VKNEAQNEISEQYLSCDKAKKRLGWKPRYNFATGLERTAAWYGKYLK
jgi:CDP-glucose 4,6-dehydratase